MTKKQLIEYIQSIPVTDDALLNVSINSEDIDTVESLGWSTPDEETTDIFCIDFILKTYPENAGCDRCGDKCRKCGSPLNIDGFCEDETCPFSDNYQDTCPYCKSGVFNEKGDCEKCGL